MAKIPYSQLYPESFSAEDYITESTYKHTRAPVKNALTIIPEAYTCETFHKIEQKRVFGNSWVAVGCTSQVKSPGDILMADVAGQSVIVTRNKDGELRAFHNVCRHRGVQMLDQDCTAVAGARIRCPYHSWAYDLNGECIGTPLFEGSDIPDDYQQVFDMGGVEDFDRADYPLFSVNVDSWGFLIFVCVAHDPTPLADQLGDLTERFAEYKLDEWEVQREMEFLLDANYKLVGENFMEYYHLPWVHPELIKVSRMEDHYRWQGRGMYTGMMTWPISSGDEGGWLGLPPMEGLEGQNLEAARFVWLIPNVAINVMPNHAYVMITKPDGPHKTVEQTYLLTHPSSSKGDDVEAELDQLMEFWRVVNMQDVEIVAKVQKGLVQNVYRGGRMCYHFEEQVHRYQNIVIDKMCGIHRIPEGDSEQAVQMFGKKAT